MSIVVQTVKVHQSKWGYHPCTKEVCFKLKQLSKMYMDAMHRYFAWQRWDRKEPHNRIMRARIRNEKNEVTGYGDSQPLPEPVLCPILVKKTKMVNTTRQGQYVKAAIEREYLEFLGNKQVFEDYRNARYPKSTPEEVKPLKLTEESIDKLLMPR